MFLGKESLPKVSFLPQLTRSRKGEVGQISFPFPPTPTSLGKVSPVKSIIGGGQK